MDPWEPGNFVFLVGKDYGLESSLLAYHNLDVRSHHQLHSILFSGPSLQLRIHIQYEMKPSDSVCIRLCTCINILLPAALDQRESQSRPRKVHLLKLKHANMIHGLYIVHQLRLNSLHWQQLGPDRVTHEVHLLIFLAAASNFEGKLLKSSMGDVV